MDVFKLVMEQMLTIFAFMATGFVLRKWNFLPENTGTVLSKLENYVLVPALVFGNQLTHCNIETFKENSQLMLYGVVLILAAILVAFPLSRLFIRNADGDSKKEYMRSIYRYALIFANFGFMGNFVVQGIWGDEMFYKYTMFCFPLWIICYSFGIYILIPKNSNEGLISNLKKGILTPPIIGMVLGMICGMLNLGQYIPRFLLTTLDNAAGCMGPLAMILAGIIIGGFEFKSLLKNGKVYWATFLRLIVIPAIFIFVLKILGTDDEIVAMALIAFATPLGMNTIVYPAAYDGDTKTGASMAMISHGLSVITIPIMYLIFVVLW
ncbi:MAG: AEC family transporter [Ruminococcaceae bacterium]|nr:AEC family transporter [Oscillospiraceae bacterium]